MTIGTIWRHKKRGTEYVILHDNASLQCASDPEFEATFEDENWIVYRNIRTCAVHVRLAPEFYDGRFVRVDGERSPENQKEG